LLDGVGLRDCDLAELRHLSGRLSGCCTSEPQRRRISGRPGGKPGRRRESAAAARQGSGIAVIGRTPQGYDPRRMFDQGLRTFGLADRRRVGWPDGSNRPRPAEQNTIFRPSAIPDQGKMALLIATSSTVRMADGLPSWKAVLELRVAPGLFAVGGVACLQSSGYGNVA